MLLQTDFHGAWKVSSYNKDDGSIAISQGKSFLCTTIAALIDAGWEPRLFHVGEVA